MARLSLTPPILIRRPAFWGRGRSRSGNNSALGTGPVALNAGALLRAGGGARTLANTFTFAAAASGTIGGSNPLTLSGPINCGTTAYFLTVNNSADTTFSGTIADTGGGFQMTSGSTGRLIILNGNNTYTGWTDIMGGKLAIGASPNALGATGNNRATLAMHASSATGCYVGTYGGPQSVTSGQPSIYVAGNGSFNNTDTLTFTAPYALDLRERGIQDSGIV